MNENLQVKTSIQQDRGVHKFDQGSVFSVLLKTAIPIVVLMVFNSTYAFVDSLMSSNYVIYNETANGGTVVGIVFPLMGLLSAFEVMIAVGVGLAYTQSMAQKNYVEAQERHNEAQTMIILVGIVVILVYAVIGIPYITTASGNWGPTPAWSDQSKQMIMDGYYYGLILCFAFIPMQILTSYIRVLRAEGKGDIAAIIPIITMPINVFFDWLLMSQFNFGLKGAGIATLIANTIGLFIMWGYVSYQGLQDKLNIKLRLPATKLRKEVVTVILLFAMGSLLRRLFDNLTVITLTSYVGNLNISAIPEYTETIWDSSWTVMTRSINMGTQLSLGIAQAMSMLISYYSNSKQDTKIGETVKYGAMSMTTVTIISSITLMLLQGVLFDAYHAYGHSGMSWTFGDPISIAFTLALIYSIPLSLQPMAVMFYAGTKNPKLTLQHSLTYNAILIMFASLGLVINLQTGHPLYLFGFVVIGSFIAFATVMTMFRYRYKQLMQN